MGSPIWIVNNKNICKACRHSKDRFKESCYCTMYGIIISYGKKKCNSYERVKAKEEENEQFDNYRESDQGS